MGGIARENKIKAISIGGTIDHAHMFDSIPPMMPVAKAVTTNKGPAHQTGVHEKFIALRKFSWQEGYGAVQYRSISDR